MCRTVKGQSVNGVRSQALICIEIAQQWRASDRVRQPEPNDQNGSSTGLLCTSSALWSMVFSYLFFFFSLKIVGFKQEFMDSFMANECADCSNKRRDTFLLFFHSFGETYPSFFGKLFFLLFSHKKPQIFNGFVLQKSYFSKKIVKNESKKCWSFLTKKIR